MPNFYAIRGLHPRLNRKQAEMLLDTQLKSTFALLPNALPNWQKDVEHLSQTIKNQLDPDEYFDFLGHGAFKEVYSLNYAYNYVAKFCSQRNDTETEETLLNAASIEGVEYAFIPTYFIKFNGLTCGAPNLVERCDSSDMEDWDSENQTYIENENWEGRYATALEIQPAILNTIEQDEYYQYWDWDWAYGEERSEPTHVLSDPAINPETGEVIPYEIICDLNIYNKHWVEEFARFHGIDGLERLANFIQKYRVGDLHFNNLGYIDGAAISPAYPEGTRLPIIIDWLSWDSDSINDIMANGILVKHERQNG